MSTIRDKSSKRREKAFKIEFSVSFQSTLKIGNKKTELEVHKLFESTLSIIIINFIIENVVESDMKDFRIHRKHI